MKGSASTPSGQMEAHPIARRCRALDGAPPGADLLDAISERHKVIVVDALDADVPPGRSCGSAPTTWRLTHPTVFPCMSSESQTLSAWQSISDCSPRHVTIIAVKPHDTRCGMDPSPPMNSGCHGLSKQFSTKIAMPAHGALVHPSCGGAYDRGDRRGCL